MTHHSHAAYGTKLDPAHVASFIKIGEQAWVELDDAEGTVYNGKVTFVDSTHIQLGDMEAMVAYVDMIGAWRDEECGEGYLFKMKAQ